MQPHFPYPPPTTNGGGALGEHALPATVGGA
ncbi:MAG: hypothetical protein ACI81V_000716, partial [Lentimonas sp.]